MAESRTESVDRMMAAVDSHVEAVGDIRRRWMCEADKATAIEGLRLDLRGKLEQIKGGSGHHAHKEAAMSEFKMQAGWVTPAQLHALIEQRGVADSPVFGRNTAQLLRSNADWRGWPAHLQKDLFQQLGITAVVMPLGPGGKLVSDCAEPTPAPAGAKELDPVPGGIYYSPLGGNFYDMDRKQGQGNEFYAKWFPRREEFPRWDPPAISGGRALNAAATNAELARAAMALMERQGVTKLVWGDVASLAQSAAEPHEAGQT